MARIRSVKPELRTSEVVGSWKREIRYAWVLLWGYLDDEGRGVDNPKRIGADLFPLDEDVTTAVMERWLTTMAARGPRVRPDRDPPLCRYEVDGFTYLHATYWKDHQRINRPTPSRIPHCPIHEKEPESA